MPLFPSAKEERIAWILILFKLYVVVVFPFYLVFRVMLSMQPLYLKTGRFERITEWFLFVYMLCGLCLVIGGVFQACGVKPKSAFETLIVALVPISVLIFWVFIAVVSHML